MRVNPTNATNTNNRSNGPMCENKSAGQSDQSSYVQSTAIDG